MAIAELMKWLEMDSGADDVMGWLVAPLLRWREDRSVKDVERLLEAIVAQTSLEIPGFTAER